jgi:signal transduction histidine kinase
MATTSKAEKIVIGIGDEIVELTGADKEAFLAQREADNVQSQLVEAKEAERKEARESAIKKLAEIAGLTKEELASIL